MTGAVVGVVLGVDDGAEAGALVAGAGATAAGGATVLVAIVFLSKEKAKQNSLAPMPYFCASGGGEIYCKSKGPSKRPPLLLRYCTITPAEEQLRVLRPESGLAAVQRRLLRRHLRSVWSQ